MIPTASGDSCAATLYRPNRDSGDHVPCVVMGAGGSLTQRDGIPAYGQHLAAAGFAALAFDYRHWGESEGQPRRRISIPRQRQDWRAAVAHARGLEGIDPSRIVAWGMSFGGAHAMMVGAEDPRIAAVIGLVPLADGLVFASRPRLLRFFARALPERLKHGSATLPMVGPAGILPPDAMPGFERIAVPNGWKNEVNTDLDYPVAMFRPVRRAAKIVAPVLLQLGEEDDLASSRAIERSAKRAPRAELRRYSIDHFGCFVPDNVDEIAGDQVEFLRRYLPQT